MGVRKSYLKNGGLSALKMQEMKALNDNLKIKTWVSVFGIRVHPAQTTDASLRNRLVLV